MSDAAATLQTVAVTPQTPARTTAGSSLAVRPAYAMAAPAFILMLMMLIGPLAGVIGLSFTDYQLGAPSFAWTCLLD